MHLKYTFYKIFTIISMVALVCSLDMGIVRAMDPDPEDGICMFCSNPISNPLGFPFSSFEKLKAYVQAENLIVESMDDGSKNLDQEHVKKKQKISLDLKIHKYQDEPDISSLIPVALDHYFEQTQHENLKDIERWNKILTDYPNVKIEILTFYKDFIELNPNNHYPNNLLNIVCCLEAVKALLNSSGAYHIMQSIERNRWWGCCVKLPNSLGSLLWLKSLAFGADCLFDYSIDPSTINFPPVIMQLTNLEALILDANEISKLPKDIIKLTKLQKLVTIENPIVKLPQGIGKLAALRELVLYDHFFQMLPNEIGMLTNLVHLDICSSRIAWGGDVHNFKLVPTSIANLTNLRHLYWDADQLSFLPTSFGKFLSKRERKYTFQTFLPGPDAWVTEADIEPNTIYLKPLMTHSPGIGKCHYLVEVPSCNKQDREGDFSYSSHEITTVGALEQKALEVVIAQKKLDPFEIRCDKFCGWESDNCAFCGLSDYVRESEDEHDRIKNCGLGYGPYKVMLVDCYNRYHDHLLVRCLLAEFGEFMGIIFPRDIASYIAGIVYTLEEQDLIAQIPQYETLESTMKSLSYRQG